jgi:isopentenyl phosphate kinase
VTNKKRNFCASKRTIANVMEEIRSSQVESMVVVHGGGSFGHPLAKKYRLSDGYVNDSQLIGFAETRQAMMKLNKIILDSAMNRQLRCVSVQPSAFIRTRNKRIEEIDLGIVRNILDLCMIPLMFGDVVLDQELKFCILSGDQLTSRLAMELEAKRMILATNVDGVFDSNPKNPEAKLMKRMTIQDVKNLVEIGAESDQGVDVTGEMIGKMREILPVVEKGIQVIVLNGRMRGRISMALSGKRVIGTTIEK